jgi:hypothetical protein
MYSTIVAAPSTVELGPSSEPSSGLSSAAVSRHLFQLHSVYNTVLYMDKLLLHQYLLLQEHDYIESLKNRSVCDNFCSLVHKLSPQRYSNDLKYFPPDTLVSTHSCMYCSACSAVLNPEQSYQVHVMQTPVPCVFCSFVVTVESISINAFLARYNANKSLVFKLLTPEQLAQYPDVVRERFSTWKQLETFFQSEKRKNCKFPAFASFPELHRARTIYLKLYSFSADLVPAMYRQLLFVNKICSNYSYWSRETVIQRAMGRYTNFIKLFKGYRKTLVPTMDIDLVWHAHQCDPESYHAFCTQTAKRLIDHDDTIAHGNLAVGYALTFIRWSEIHKTPYSYHPPSWSAWRSGLGPRFCLAPFSYCYGSMQWIKHSQTTGFEIDLDLLKLSVIGSPVTETADPNSQLALILTGSLSDFGARARAERAAIEAAAEARRRPNGRPRGGRSGGGGGGCGGGGCGAGGGCGGGDGGGGGCGGGGCGGGGCGGGGCGGG